MKTESTDKAAIKTELGAGSELCSSAWLAEMEAELSQAGQQRQRMASGTYDQLTEAIGYSEGLEFALKAWRRLSASDRT